MSGGDYFPSLDTTQVQTTSSIIYVTITVTPHSHPSQSPFTVTLLVAVKHSISLQYTPVLCLLMNDDLLSIIYTHPLTARLSSPQSTVCTILLSQTSQFTHNISHLPIIFPTYPPLTAPLPSPPRSTGCTVIFYSCSRPNSPITSNPSRQP